MSTITFCYKAEVRWCDPDSPHGQVEQQRWYASPWASPPQFLLQQTANSILNALVKVFGIDCQENLDALSK